MPEHMERTAWCVYQVAPRIRVVRIHDWSTRAWIRSSAYVMARVMRLGWTGTLRGRAEDEHACEQCSAEYTTTIHDSSLTVQSYAASGV